MKNLSELKINPKNPRIIKDEKFKLLVKNIEKFPNMLKFRPIIYDENGIILGGNMRYKALIELGYKQIPEEWAKCASELNEDEKRKFIILDNADFGEWNNRLLKSDWDELELGEMNVEIEYTRVESEFNERGDSEQKEMKYPIVIILTEKQYEKWSKMKDDIGENDNNEAFFKLVKMNKKQP